MWHVKIESVTIRITQVKLNDAQRRCEALRKKEEEGWYTGSIHDIGGVIYRMPPKPTFAEVANDAKEKLVKYGCLSTADTPIVWRGHTPYRDLVG